VLDESKIGEERRVKYLEGREKDRTSSSFVELESLDI
jgi:hypothetical protein